MSIPGYNVRKAAQLVAFFAKQQGGTINVLKLSKLVYLADREFMAKYDRPILYDQLASMDHGPVGSRTLDYINGYAVAERGKWDDFVANRAGYEVGLSRAELDEDDLDELSDAELGVLSEVWDRFGRMSQYQLRDYTHENCPEWENPEGSSDPIPYERVFKFLGKRHSAELARDIARARHLDSALAEAQ